MPLETFPRKPNGRLFGYCHECKKQKARLHYRDNKAAYVRNMKIRENELRAQVAALKSKPCTDCGNSFPSCAMQFDHLRDKIMDVSRMVTEGYSFENILLEISKCQLVCGNCHAIRTKHRMGFVIQVTDHKNMYVGDIDKRNWTYMPITWEITNGVPSYTFEEATFIKNKLGKGHEIVNIGDMVYQK